MICSDKYPSKGNIKLIQKLIPVGRYSKSFQTYLPYYFHNDIIYRSAGLEKHILKRHPDCVQYIALIPDIISAPDYIGINPHEPQASFELVKKVSDNVQIGIKLDQNNNYWYVATLHTITNAKLLHGIQNGRLHQFDKTTDIFYNQNT